MLNILLRIADDRLLSRRAGGGVNAHQLLLRDGKQAVRIIVPQIGFIGKGKLYNIVDRLNILRLQADFIKFRTVEGDVLIAVFDHLFQPLGLQRAQSLPVGTLHLGLEIFLRFHSLINHPFTVLERRRVRQRAKPASSLFAVQPS